MEAVIKVKISELNIAFLERVKTFFQGKDDVELTISFDDPQQNYYEALNCSKEDLEQGNGLVTFTIEELETYANSKRA